MARIIMLDSGPLGKVVGRPGSPPADRCRAWLDGLKWAGCLIYVPEIADYEIRRKLTHIGSTGSLTRLDDLARNHFYLAIHTPAMQLAADFWADARRRGLPTAGDHSLDADMILAAQAFLAPGLGDTVTVATENVGHLARFVDARPWTAIT